MCSRCVLSHLHAALLRVCALSFCVCGPGKGHPMHCSFVAPSHSSKHAAVPQVTLDNNPPADSTSTLTATGGRTTLARKQAQWAQQDSLDPAASAFGTTTNSSLLRGALGAAQREGAMDASAGTRKMQVRRVPCLPADGQR